MTTSYKQIICKINTECPSSAILEKVMSRIRQMEERRLRIMALSHGIITVVILIFFIPIINNFISNIAQSEFSQYTSLLISDWSTLMNNWRPIFLSIAESWPSLPSILLLGAFIVFANSLRRVVINTFTLSTYKHAHL